MASAAALKLMPRSVCSEARLSPSGISKWLGVSVSGRTKRRSPSSSTITICPTSSGEGRTIDDQPRLLVLDLTGPPPRDGPADGQVGRTVSSARTVRVAAPFVLSPTLRSTASNVVGAPAAPLDRQAHVCLATELLAADADARDGGRPRRDRAHGASPQPPIRNPRTRRRVRSRDRGGVLTRAAEGGRPQALEGLARLELAGRRRHPDGVGRQPDPQGRRTCGEAQRWIEDQRLAVQADVDRCARGDLEDFGLPAVEPGEAVRVAGRDGGEEPGRGSVVLDLEGVDAELPVSMRGRLADPLR